jgi:hypothetical protein
MDPEPTIAVTAGTRRLIMTTKQDRSRRLELYDHATDRLEQDDLAGTQDDLARQLETTASDYLARPKVAWGEPVDVEIDDLQAGQLRALGYVVR